MHVAEEEEQQEIDFEELLSNDEQANKRPLISHLCTAWPVAQQDCSTLVKCSYNVAIGMGSYQVTYFEISFALILC